jgi:RHS repeat-associated protein
MGGVRGQVLAYTDTVNWTMNCDTTQNGFTLTNTYVIGPSGEQLTETDGNGNWVHTNVFAAGQLLATYSYIDSSHTTTDTYFALGDWLGTKRAEVSAGGCGTGYASLPYGGDLTAVSLPGFTQCPDATEHHFTGKERDAESGNDYFGARYYGSSMGRFTSPDNGSDQEASNPQSWNLYGYVQNNPLTNTDPDGHDCINASNASSGTVSIIPTSNPGDCGKGFTYVDGTINASSLTYNSGTGILSFNTSNYANGSGMAATNVMQLGNTADPDTLRAGVFQGNAARWNNAAGTVGPMAGYEMGAILMLLDPLLAGTSPEVALGIGGVGASRAVSDVVQRATSAVGNQQTTVASEDVAKQAADRFVGPGSREITQSYGNRAGQPIGRISADGQRVVRFDTNASTPHYNFENNITGGNLHVYF